MTQVDLSRKQKQGHREQSYVAKGEGLGEGMEWEVGVSRHKLLYMEWANNKTLLYSPENYILYLMINHNGK